MNAPDTGPAIFRFGVFELDTLAHGLRRQGRRVRLQEQPYQVLLMLVERSDTVVTREELRQALWPSSVYVDFDHGLNNAMGRLREVLGDAAAMPTFIETVPRVGYRFIYPVARSASSSPTASQQIAGESPPPVLDPERIATDPTDGAWFRRPTAGVVAAGVALLALLPAFWPSQHSAEEVKAGMDLPTEPSLAVLPFVNMSPDKENEYFTDGLSDELLGRIAAIRGLKVASQTGSFRFKGKRESPAVIARELQVTHLLEGSVRRSGNRVRINAQLIDARDGYHRWSETFDRELTDTFKMQEEIATAVANALQVKLLTASENRWGGQIPPESAYAGGERLQHSTLSLL